MGGRLPVHGDGDLVHLLGNGGGHIHRVGQLLNPSGQVLGNHHQGVVIAAGDVHADVRAAAHEGGHVGGGDADLTPGDIPAQLPHELGNILTAPVPLLLVAEDQIDRGGLRLGQVVDGLQLGDIFHRQVHHPVGDGGGVLHLGAGGGADGDLDHALVHLGHEDHLGGHAGGDEKSHQSHRYPHADNQMPDKEAQQGGVALGQPAAQARLAGGQLFGLALRPPLCLPPPPVLVQEQIAQQRDQGDGNDQRS